MNFIRFILVCALLGGGFAAFAEEKVVSQTLRAQMADVVDVILKDVPEEQKKQLPPGVKNADELKEMMLKQMDPLLTVSAAEEEKFKKGEFDDERNKKQMTEFIATTDKLKIDLPQVTQIFIKEFKDGKLSGARLETAGRLNQMVMQKINSQLRK